MKQASNVFLVLVYLLYSGKCHTILPRQTTEITGPMTSDGNGTTESLKNLLKNLTEDSFQPYNTEDLPNDVIFQLYTRSHPNTYSTLKLTKEADVGDFNSRKQTKVMIHGWRANGDYLAHLRKGYLEAGDYNVIVVDWSKPASDFHYATVTNNVKVFGEYVASLIDFLVTHHGLRLEDLHIVGHSVGAQIAGVAGNRTKSGKPARITGLDPAGPGFCSESLENRLDFTDGQFVDVIHTCGEIMGMKARIGHADFYPNGGTATQPGCNDSSDNYTDSVFPPFVSCSHARALEFFVDSLTTTTGFVSYKCSNWNDFKHGNCFQNARMLMGELTDTSCRGSYYLQTARSSPFPLGNISTVVDMDTTANEKTRAFAEFIRKDVPVC